LNGEGRGKFPVFDRFAQFQFDKNLSLKDLLDDFEAIRNNNLGELKSLNISGADLDKTGIHPDFGQVTLRQLLATWVAHDLDHLYQIARVMAKRYQDDAGPWKAYLRILRQ
ncbi:MAG TPA: DinB family protein, partial [Saprospiraceae bacterium]|nr:DinB family protein [Saprospiraceae bacterium]